MASVRLWHIPVSHYSEKVRWALEYKRVPHTRRAPTVGLHPPYCLWLTRGRSSRLPMLELDGRRIPDSSAILEALEERYPDPPLVPADPGERRRALEAEEWLDEELAPRVRLLGFHEFRKDPAAFAEIGRLLAPAVFSALGPLATAYAKAFTALRYDAASEAGAAEARERIPSLLDRLGDELDGREYIAGDRFSIADLTAAAVIYPLLLPPQMPLSRLRIPDALDRYREPLLEHPAMVWAAEIFRRHR